MLFAVPKFILYIFSLFYGLGILARKLFYDLGIFTRHEVPLRVISVGNLTLGGTGKTPFVITLARILKDDLKKETAVLIRGYGWDEQAMLKKNMADVPVLVGEDRAKSADRAIKLYGSTAAILDDGFQHWELARDLDIVLIDSGNPFGNGHLFPRGVLREGKDAIRRADVVVFTKVNKKAADINALKDELKNIKHNLIFLEAAHKAKYLYDAKNGKHHELAFVKGKRAMLISSIGDPGYFEETVRDIGVDVAGHIVFGDHHNYTQADVERIARRCNEKAFDIMITTEKDAVKLDRLSISFAKYTLMTLVVENEITNGREILIDRLHSLYNS